jgi:hypothetical protein
MLDSIGSGKAPPPRPQPAKPSNTGVPRTASPAPKPQHPTTGVSQASTLKRRAEDTASASTNKTDKPITAPPGTIPAKKPTLPAKPVPPVASNLASTTKPATQVRDSNQKSTTNAPAFPAKPAPAKGSFADLMARAQAQNAPQTFGIIKHTKATPKEKLSRREQERRNAKASARTEKSGSGAIAKTEKSRSASPTKDAVQSGRITKPGPPKSTYKGTLGLSTGRSKPRQANKSRFDDYLGTDEEDNSEIEDEGEDGYESSDMEGGFDDLEMEEAQAIRVAKQEDARELAEENRLKAEKEERRRRLAALAKKGRK